jgi:biopolymer transport protein ExbD
MGNEQGSVADETDQVIVEWELMMKAQLEQASKWSDSTKAEDEVVISANKKVRYSLVVCLVVMKLTYT